MITHLDARVAFILAAQREFGMLYLWGGESRKEGGHDCSGLVCSALSAVARSWPELYDGQRRSSSGLFAYFTGRGCEPIEPPWPPGSLVFFHPSTGGRVYHVLIHAMTVPALDGRLAVGPVGIEAGGGGSRNVSPRASLLRPAGVRWTASDIHGPAARRVLDPFEVLL